MIFQEPDLSAQALGIKQPGSSPTKLDEIDVRGRIFQEILQIEFAHPFIEDKGEPLGARLRHPGR